MIEETLIIRTFKSTVLYNKTLIGDIDSILLVILWILASLAFYWIFYVPVTWTKVIIIFFFGFNLRSSLLYTMIMYLCVCDFC